MTESDYNNPLILTTPNIRGQRVRDAQWLLAGHNAWANKQSPIHTYYGRIDGIFGVSTAGSAKRAKWWLGYPSNQVTPTFGKLLYNLLKGDSSLSPEWAARRQKRLNADQDSVKSRAFQIAVGEIGTKESPFGSNRQKYGDWYGMNGVPWCAIFVSYCIAKAGRTAWRYSYVPNISSDAVRGVNGMSPTYSPQRGDLVCYTLHGDVDCHVAFFDEWISSAQQEFHDLGGNTGPTNFSNGGEVLRQTRDVSLVHRFVRLTL
jgi:hypothetical protein